jgi:hypothetical protein
VVRDGARTLSKWRGTSDLKCRERAAEPRTPIYENAELLCRHGLLPPQNMYVPLELLLDRLARTGELTAEGPRLMWTNDGSRFELKGSARCQHYPDLDFGVMARIQGHVDLVHEDTGRVIDSHKIDDSARQTCAELLQDDDGVKNRLSGMVNQFRTTTRAYRAQ